MRVTLESKSFRTIWTPSTPTLLGENKMLITRSSCPAATRGVGSSGPSVTITEVGQLRLNKEATKAFGLDKTFVMVNLDDERNVTLSVYASIKGLKVDGKPATEADFFKLTYTKKAGTEDLDGSCYSAMSSLFKHEAVAYNYKASGSQSFEAVLGAKGTVTFHLPTGSLVPRPKVHRTKKVKPATTTPAASGPVLQSID